ncbi:MAG: RdgB/HAM1 family non-canonical purine NTP pyrophosphatase [Myxococcota bacterium]
MEVFVATANAHKVEEIAAILAPMGLTVRSLLDHPELPEAPETHDTFEGNALQKAQFAFDRLGIPALADDSGLEVDALGGAPGVHSKRYSAEATAASNNQKLLQALHGQSHRTARFRCVVALVTGSWSGTVSGACEGQILGELKGDGGFGYDPLFAPDDLPGRSMAEATPAEKNAISHRGRGFRQVPDLLRRAGLT